MTQEIVQEIEQQIQRWHYSAIILHSTCLILGIISVVSSIIVATFVEELGNFNTKILAALSAGSLAVINTTGIQQKGNGFRQAQRHLKAAMLKFQSDPSSIGDLAKAFAEAETMIGDVEIKIRDFEKP